MQANGVAGKSPANPPTRPRTVPAFRLTPILLGALVGALYAAVLRVVDEAWPFYHPAHRVLDWTISIVLGIVLGLLADALRSRAERARAEHREVEQLRERIRGTERDQAVWVLASSLLHELRNPLHTLGLALEELDRGDPDPSHRPLLVEARQAAERMTERFKRLGALADQPSHLAAAYDLGQLVRSTAARFDAIAKTFGARVEVVGPSSLEVVGDAGMIRAALENLVSNAVDAVRPRRDGRVELSLDSEGGLARVRVTDNGPGIPEDVAADVFQPLRSTKAPLHGLGLGLPIARGLARAQQGDVEWEACSQGACFVLSVPVTGPEREDET